MEEEDHETVPPELQDSSLINNNRPTLHNPAPGVAHDAELDLNVLSPSSALGNGMQEMVLQQGCADLK